MCLNSSMLLSILNITQNSLNWLPKDRNLDNQPPKDRSLNDLKVHASCVLMSFYYLIKNIHL